ncbi:uncharacterized protein EURHEDRAFT_412141, partial [Aspergillus ruber CBS 135680]
MPHRDSCHALCHAWCPNSGSSTSSLETDLPLAMQDDIAELRRQLEEERRAREEERWAREEAERLQEEADRTTTATQLSISPSRSLPRISVTDDPSRDERDPD